MNDDDNGDARKRKSGACDFDLNLRLSPPSQRPRQESPTALDFTLSLPMPAPESPIMMLRLGSLQGEPLLQTRYPFLRSPTAMVGSSHASDSQPLHPLYRYQSLPTTTMVESDSRPLHPLYRYQSLPTATMVESDSQPLHPLYRFQSLPPATPAAAHIAGGCSEDTSSSPLPMRDSVLSRTIRPRRNNFHGGPRGGKDEIIEPPFPWATNRRAVVYNKAELIKKGIRTITGDVQCKRCEHKGIIEYDLEEKYMEVARYIAANKHLMHDRAPQDWIAPVFPPCPECKQQNSMKPVVSPKKRAINWLFMLLGQTLGCCTLEQLKYFCKHTKNHRTGAKDRVLYLTFLGICKQLDPLDLYDYDR